VPVKVSPTLKVFPVSISLPFSKSKIMPSALPLPSKSVGIIGFSSPVIEESFLIVQKLFQFYSNKLHLLAEVRDQTKA
jgi:hypothetical protein